MDIKFVFFGTPEVSVTILEALKEEGLVPDLIVTAPDKPRGRGMEVSPPPAKVWAGNNKVPVLQPPKLRGNEEFLKDLNFHTPDEGWDLFVVVAYGKIIPKGILDIPKKGAINLHYSLLPKLRGPAPVEGAILQDEYPTGVTVLLMDEEMDHGPILLQEVVEIDEWPTRKKNLFKKMNEVGGRLLAEGMRSWIKGEIVAQEQNHKEATYVKMIKKEDGLLDLEDDDYLNWRKFLAYENWPRTYFYREKGDKKERIIISDAEFENGEFKIKKVIPEGKKEMTWKQFQNWHQ